MYNIFAYVMNMIFHWIILFLIIVYITWLIIRRLPNFPIPLKRMLLRMPPWRPLERAGVLPFMDDIRKIIFSTASFERRIEISATAFGKFFDKSFTYLASFMKSKVDKAPEPDNLVLSNNTGELDVKSVRKGVRQGTNYEQDEVDYIQDEYLHCIEEGAVPVYDNMGMDTAKAVTQNNTNAILCKIQSFTTYSNVINNRMSM